MVVRVTTVPVTVGTMMVMAFWRAVAMLPRLEATEGRMEVSIEETTVVAGLGC